MVRSSTATAAPKGRKRGSSAIQAILRQRVMTGVWGPNDRLPSERDLAEELNVCAATIQRHLRELQNEGLIWGWPGKGRFVTGVGQRPRTGNIGVVLFDSRHMAKPAMSDVVASVGAVAAEAKCGLRIFIGNELPMNNPGSADASDPTNAGFLGSMFNLGVDGLIVLTQRINPEAIRQLACTVPVVCSYLLPLPNASCLVFDMASGTHEATRHLYDLGHRHIALITKDSSDAFGRAARDGARLAVGGLAKDDAEVNLAIYTAVEFAQSEGYRLGREILGKSDRPTAIICVDDTLPLGVLQAAQELGLRIPEDLSLIAWHDTLVNRKPVTITSVSFDRTDAGARMCRRLLESIEHPERQFEPEYLRPHLLIRQSTAAPQVDAK
jgi:DNA-binding LacI/PurR family transcriptional regulator